MSAALFAKLGVLVLAVGGSAVGTLALRQSRLQAAHEATEARQRMRAHAETTMELRAEIARRVAPESLAVLAAEHPDLVPAIEARHGPDGALARDPERSPGRPRAGSGGGP